MTVNISWNECWLSLFSEMTSPTKTKFLQDVEIVRLIQKTEDTIQIEILENAPVVLVKYLREYLRPRAIKKLLPGTYVEPSTQPRRVLPDKIYMDIAKRLRR